MTVELAQQSTARAEAIPATGAEAAFAEVLAEVLRVDRVSTDSNFFDDLGADSLTMARFCARVRKRPDLPSASIKDVYEHPTITRLAAELAGPASAEYVAPTSPTPAPSPAPRAVGTLQYVLCGALQLLVVLGYSYLGALVLSWGYSSIAEGSGFGETYLRSVLFGGVSFLALCAIPIVAKWALVGRWRPRRIRAWSLGYVRFWTVKTLVRANPLVLFIGSPVYVLYLRALGAKVGRNVTILSRHVPVCTDLLEVGDGAVIRKNSFFNCYRAAGGTIETGPVAIGEGAYVGEETVLDIEGSLGDGAQLGHSSSLHSGQAVPAGERWQGSPAQQRTRFDYRGAEPLPERRGRRFAYGAGQLVAALLVYVPLVTGGFTALADGLPQIAFPGESGGFESLTFWRDALVASGALFFGAVLLGLALVLTVPRVLNLAIEPDRTYPLYGFHYGIHRAIRRMTNVKLFPRLFGDSSYIVHYLRGLGYDLSRVEQTGSNFGLEVEHETPFHASVGTGTMAADGLSIINADYSSTSFRVSRASIGSQSFLGNYVAYPAQSRAGDDCLLATKVMVPVEEDVQVGGGRLGSPSFPIPRTVERDRRFDDIKGAQELPRRLAAKNRHNAVTIALYLLTRWGYVFGLTLLAGGAAALYGGLGAAAFALAGFLALPFRFGYFALIERASTSFRPLQPRYCSIYDPYFWWHERFWKLSTQPRILDGTPLKGPMWRALGVRIGKRVLDDGCAIVEKTLVTIGDASTLNEGSVIQAHSQEDGAFKSDRIAIGSGCTVGTRALVHYDTAMGDGAQLAPDSFLMKGAEVPPDARWQGNPAIERSSSCAG